MKPFWRRGTYAKSANISTIWQKVFDQLANALTVRISPGNPRFFDAFSTTATAIASVAATNAPSPAAPTVSSDPHFGAVEEIRLGEFVRANSAPSVRIVFRSATAGQDCTITIWHRLENDTYTYMQDHKGVVLTDGEEFLDEHCAYRPVYIQVTACHAAGGTLFIGPA